MDNATLSHGSLFSGVGGFDLGFERAGFKTLWQVEIDAYATKVLEQHFPGVRRFGDIKQFISDIKRGIIVVCNEDTMVSVPSAKRINEPGKVAATVNPAIPNRCQHGDLETNNIIDKSNEPGTKRKSGKSMNAMEGNAPVAVNLENSFLPSTIKQGEETPSVVGITRKPGSSLSNTDTPPTTKSFATTATTPNIITEPVRIRRVNVLTAGVPCQPASVAGKRRGAADPRWLWPETFEVVRLLHPTWCIFENVYGLLNLDGGVVFESLCAELETLGYEIQTFCIPACAVDAPHRRERLWIMGYAADDGQSASEVTRSTPSRSDSGATRTEQTSQPTGSSQQHADVAHAAHQLRNRSRDAGTAGREESANRRHVADAKSRGGRQSQARNRREVLAGGSEKIGRHEGWSTQCRLGGSAHGPAGGMDCGGWECGLPRVTTKQANRVQRLEALGNAVVPPLVEELAWMIRRVMEQTEDA